MPFIPFIIVVVAGEILGCAISIRSNPAGETTFNDPETDAFERSGGAIVLRVSTLKKSN
jgi:hypothetical protein